MMTYHVSQEIRERIEQDFPPEKQMKVEKILHRYLTENICSDIELVRLAAFELAKGKLWLLVHNVRVARYDYRDLLYWAYARNQDE